ncbi:hypothetical protein F5883DRAFT_661263 [Diaporthe sp. PMI_573]|nr:hypothetical protein F5883DRAFT_661263 [Diaporthaceae sp. PMI_573]
MPSPVSFQHSQINSDAPFNPSELKSRVPYNPFYLEGEPNIAPDNTRASVGGGIISGPLQQALEEQGFFTPAGQAKTVGYCVDTDDDKDILWSLRGAGAGTLAVVVELRIKVYPTPKLFAGFLGFPITEVATVFERFKQIVSEEGIPDEFSGDAIIARPEMLKLAGSQPCFIFYWCWAAVGGDVTPARVYLERMKSLGTVLINTVQQTTTASFGGGDSSSSAFFPSCTVSGLEPTLGEIFARHLPPQPLAAVVVHYNHELAVRSGTDDGVGTIFGRRQQHSILGFHGGTSVDTFSTPDALSQATDWVNVLKKRISSSGVLLSHSFPRFSPQNEVEPVIFLGPKAADRLARLKRRVDGGDFFGKSYPRLSQMASQTLEEEF